MRHVRYGFLQLLILAVLISLTAVAIVPLRNRVQEKLNDFKLGFIDRIESVTGTSIRYESISPSIFRFLEIRDLELYGGPDRSVRLIRISRVRVYFSLVNVIRGDFDRAVREVSVENSGIEIDAQRDVELLGIFGSETAASERGFFEKLPDFVLSGRNLSVSYRSEDLSIEVGKLNFRLDSREDLVDIDASGIVQVRDDSGRIGIETVKGTIRAGGEVGKDGAWSEVRLTMEEISGGSITLPRLTLQVTQDNEVWTVRKIQDKIPLDLTAVIEPGFRSVSASFTAEAFTPRSLISVAEAPEMILSLLDIPFSGEGQAVFEPASSSFDFKGSLSALIPEHLAGIAARIDARFEGDTEGLRFERLRAVTRYGTVSFNGNVSVPGFLPSGRFHIDSITYPGVPAETTWFEVSNDGKDIRVTDGEVRGNGASIDGIRIETTRTGDSVDFSASLGLSGGTAAVEGSLQIEPDPFLELSVDIFDTGIAPYAGLFFASSAGVDFLGSFSVTGSGFISTDFDRFSFSVPDLTLRNSEAGTLYRAAVAGSNERVEIRSVTIPIGTETVTGSLLADFREPQQIQLSSSIDFRGITYPLTGLYNPGRGLLIRGENGLTAGMSIRADRATFSITSRELPVMIGEKPVYATLDAEGYYERGDRWELFLRESSILGLALFPEQESNVTVTGTVRPGTAEFSEVVYWDPLSRLQGSGSLTFDPRFESLGASIDLSNGNGENYSVEIGLDEDTIDLSAEFSRAQIVRLADLGITGLASGVLSASGPITDPSVSLDARIDEGIFNGDPFSAAGIIVYADGGATAEELSVQYLSHVIYEGKGSVSLTEGSFSMAARYRGIFQNDSINAEVEIDGRIRPAGERIVLEDIGEADFTGTVAIEEIQFAGEVKDPWFFYTERADGFLTLEGGPSRAISGSLDREGSFSITFSNPLPLTFRAEGSLVESVIDASLMDVVLDLSSLDPFLSIPYFQFVSGEARGNLGITGNINDPDIFGQLRGDALYARTPVVPEVIGPVATTLYFNGKDLNLVDVVLPVGAGRVVGNAQFTIDHWLPEIYDIQLVTGQKPGAHIKYIFEGTEVDGYAQGSIRITGDSLGTEIEGDFVIERCSITIIEENEYEVPKGGDPSSYTVVDVRFTTGRQVEFLWPTRAFPILRGYADTGMKLAIQSDSRDGTYRMDGDIKFKGGEIFYFRRNFYIKSGRIIFQENETKWDPVLSAEAELREISSAGENVTIYLTLEERPMSQFTPTFSSKPSHSGAEIFSMLGASILAAPGGEDIGLGSAVLLTSDILSQFAVIRAFEQRVKDTFSLDLFSIRTQMLQNLISERILGSDSGNGEGSSLGKYLDNTTVFLGKYFGNDIFLEAMIRLKTNELFLTDLTVRNELSVDSEIRLEWRTPLFMLELSMLPDLDDPLGSIRSSSLGLSWGFSF